MTVWEYDLSIDASMNRVRLPLGAEILTVGRQGHSLQMWVRVNEKETKSEERYFLIRATGEAGTSGLYVGTVFLVAPIIVFHVFEVPAAEEKAADLKTEDRATAVDPLIRSAVGADVEAGS